MKVCFVMNVSKIAHCDLKVRERSLRHPMTKFEYIYYKTNLQPPPLIKTKTKNTIPISTPNQGGGSNTPFLFRGVDWFPFAPNSGQYPISLFCSFPRSKEMLNFCKQNFLLIKLRIFVYFLIPPPLIQKIVKLECGPPNYGGIFNNCQQS